jgi:hypothetical protein
VFKKEIFIILKARVKKELKIIIRIIEDKACK